MKNPSIKTLLDCRSGLGISSHGSARFIGGGGSSKQEPPSANIADTPEAKDYRQDLYPLLTQGIQGKGFGPAALTNKRWANLRSGYDKAFAGAESNLQSQMGRIVNPADSRVKAFMSQNLARTYNTGVDNLNRAQRQEFDTDRDIAMNLTGDALAREQRMTISGTQATNAAMLTQMGREAQFGNFATNVAGGVGSGLVDAYFAQKMSGGTSP